MQENTWGIGWLNTHREWNDLGVGTSRTRPGSAGSIPGTEGADPTSDEFFRRLLMIAKDTRQMSGGMHPGDVLPTSGNWEPLNCSHSGL